MRRTAYNTQYKALQREDPKFYQDELEKQRESYLEKKKERLDALNALPEE